MNAYMNFFDDATIYAILQSLSPLCKDPKEDIIFQLILKIVDEYLQFPADIDDPHDMYMWNTE